MVYIDKESTSITLPRHNTTINGDSYSLVLRSQINNEIRLVERGADISTDKLTFVFDIENKPFIENGEYEYYIFIDDNTEDIIEKGLLIFGEYSKPQIISTDVQKKNLVFNGKRKNGSNND